MTDPPAQQPARTTALQLHDLSVAYQVRGRDIPVVKGLTLHVNPGSAYGLVGESGSGKSTAALAAVRYLPRNGRVTGGSVSIEGQDLLAMSAAQLRAVRAGTVSMVYQDPGRALNPCLRIGRQIVEVFALQGLPPATCAQLAAGMLSRVRISDPARVMALFPNEISGGMQQRVVIAMALANNPKLLILDEPTTGLDATVEAGVLDLISRLRLEFRMATLFISHSLAVISRMCDTVGVLYAGELVEEAPTAQLFAAPKHPYTAALLSCVPRFGFRKIDGPLTTIVGAPPGPAAPPAGCIFAPRCPLVTDTCRRETPSLADLGGRLSRCHYPERTAAAAVNAPLAGPSAAASGAAAAALGLRRLSKTYRVGGGRLQALHDVSLELAAGETLGLVGESGSGKSTLAKLVLGLETPDAGGAVELNGQPVPAAVARRSRAQLKALQMVFQNPGSALNGAHTVRRLIGRALALVDSTRAARAARLLALLDAVRLPRAQLDAKPRALSGGLQQRVAIARAIAGAPQVVVCDEPTSALDLSVQASIINLLADLQAAEKISYVFISHDLSLVYYLADRIAVLYLGRLMELGPARQVFEGPQHPYTEVLLAAHASAAREAPTRLAADQEPSGAPDSSRGCRFQSRCPRSLGALCEEQEPELLPAGPGHAIRCHIDAAELRRLQLAAKPPASDKMGAIQE